MSAAHEIDLQRARLLRRHVCQLDRHVAGWRSRIKAGQDTDGPLLRVLEVAVTWYKIHLRWSHSEPGTLIGVLPPATGLPACSYAGVIWWGKESYTPSRLRAGGSGAET